MKLSSSINRKNRVKIFFLQTIVDVGSVVNVLFKGLKIIIEAIIENGVI
jgi:hypothetical protein